MRRALLSFEECCGVCGKRMGGERVGGGWEGREKVDYEGDVV